MQWLVGVVGIALCACLVAACGGDKLGVQLNESGQCCCEFRADSSPDVARYAWETPTRCEAGLSGACGVADTCHISMGAGVDDETYRSPLPDAGP